MWHEFLFRSVWPLWGGVGAGVGWGGGGVRAGPGRDEGQGMAGWGPGWGGVGWGGGPGSGEEGVGWGPGRDEGQGMAGWGPGWGGDRGGLGGGGRAGGGGGVLGHPTSADLTLTQMSICIALSLQDNNANQLRTYCTINMDCHKLINQVFNHRVFHHVKHMNKTC